MNDKNHSDALMRVVVSLMKNVFGPLDSNLILHISIGQDEILTV